MKSQILVSSETMRVDYFCHDNPIKENLAYTFSHYQSYDLNGNNNGGAVFYKNGYDVIAFKVSNDDWFQSVPPSVFDQIRNICTLKKYKKKIAYGGSMGGFGSIAFSKLLDCNISVAFCPQYSIDEAFDQRYAKQAKNIEFVYRISGESISKSCKYFIFYDNEYVPDKLQVEKLLEVIPIENTKLVTLPLCGHDPMGYLRDICLLKDVAIKIADNCNVDDLDFFKYRKSSKVYLWNLSQKLMKRKHLKFSLLVIELAIKLDENNSAFKHLKNSLHEKINKPRG